MLDLDRSRLTLDELMAMWLYKVEEYSLKHLSFRDDKLPALSGLAATIASGPCNSLVRTFPTYLAGVWSSDIARQMFWCPKTPLQKNRSSEQPLLPAQESPAPSRSWPSCSCDGPVTFYESLQHLQKYRPRLPLVKNKVLSH